MTTSSRAVLVHVQKLQAGCTSVHTAGGRAISRIFPLLKEKASRGNFSAAGGGTVPTGVGKMILFGNGWYEANIRDWTL